MSNNRRRMLICYDISDARRLQRVHQTVRDYGFPVQYSIFEAELDESAIGQLLDDLEPLIDPTEDKVHLYPLGPADKDRTLGLSPNDNPILLLI